MGQLWQWHLPQESSPFFSWAGLFLFWAWTSWPLSRLLLLKRAPKCFSFHCSQHPTLPSSCEDAKDFLLNASVVRSGMGALSQLKPSLLFAQAPKLPPCSWVPPQYFLSLALHPFPVQSLLMLPLVLAMGMCFGHLHCMLLLAEARYFSFLLLIYCHLIEALL